MPTTYLDSATGAAVIQWTDSPAKDQHLYFTSPSVTADDRYLVFISERSGDPNLFVIDRAEYFATPKNDGAVPRQLSANTAGLLHSYVYPQGGARGLSKASPCLDAARRQIYYVRDDTVFRVALDDAAPREEKIFALPAGWFGGFSHISPDGKTLAICCADPRAFVDPAANQWEQMRLAAPRFGAENLTSKIYQIDTASGDLKNLTAAPFWVSHVQYDPRGSGRLIFNREGFFDDRPDAPPHNRIWCLETTGEFRPLNPEPTGEWRSHENWASDGSAIVYHGGRDKQTFVAARRWDGELLYETSIAGVNFWHATAAPDGKRLVADCPDGFIALIDPATQQSEKLCRHDTTTDDQDAHAHPLATPRGVVFTSLRSGVCNVYETLREW
jgi:Tol biopolymer transport system component